jgi:formiminotetrahydrofolate cyclodeaminase
MNKFATGILASLIFAAGSAHAATTDDACTALVDARGHLISMIASLDKASQGGLKAKIQAASEKVDGIVNSLQSSHEAQIKAFKPVWDAFKKTRDEEIIPAIMAGKNGEAKKLATGVQADRMKQMRTALGCK